MTYADSVTVSAINVGSSLPRWPDRVECRVHCFLDVSMYPESPVLVKTEAATLLQAIVVISVSLIFLAGYLRYVATYPFPLSPPTIITYRPNHQKQSPPSAQDNPVPPSATTSTTRNTTDNALSGSNRANTMPLSSSSGPSSRGKQSNEGRSHARPRPQADRKLASQMLHQAQMLFEEGQYSEALTQCDALLTKDPENSTAKELRNNIQKAIDILKP